MSDRVDLHPSISLKPATTSPVILLILYPSYNLKRKKRIRQISLKVTNFALSFLAVSMFVRYCTHSFILMYFILTRVGTLIVATIYLQLIQNRYMFRSFTVLQCSVQPVASDVEVVGYL